MDVTEDANGTYWSGGKTHPNFGQAPSRLKVWPRTALGTAAKSSDSTIGEAVENNMVEAIQSELVPASQVQCGIKDVLNGGALELSYTFHGTHAALPFGYDARKLSLPWGKLGMHVPWPWNKD